jgi:hypothetical protein
MNDTDRFEPGQPRGPRWNRAYVLAAALLIGSLLISILTPLKLFILFVPLILAGPLLRRGRR